MSFYIPIKELKKRVQYRLHLNKAVDMAYNGVNLTLPVAYDLNKYRNFVYDQGQLGSCTANAFCAGFRILSASQDQNIGFNPSRLYFYYHERAIEGTVSTDSGADVVDGLRFVEYHGIASENDWPYDINKFAIAPPKYVELIAPQHKIGHYNTIKINHNLLTNIKYFIKINSPVLIAISIYESFESETVAKTGHVPIPDIKSESCLGGHELCLIGYSDETELFTVLNSWSEGWGDNGLCYIPYDYLSDPNLGHEFTVFSI
jgi:C1A family cysteine protease